MWAVALAVASFCEPGGQGELLHGLLAQRAAEEHNWLEKWWDNSYLDIRTCRPACCSWGVLPVALGAKFAGATVRV